MSTGLFLLLFYIVSGAIGSGMTYAYFQRKFPTIAYDQNFDDGMFAIFAFITGPISMVTALIGYWNDSRFYGWKMPFSKFTAEEYEKYASPMDKRYHIFDGK